MKNKRDWSAFHSRRRPKGWNGSKAKSARQALGLSLRATSEKVGVSHVTLLDWERGAHFPPEDKARRLRRILGID